MKYILPPILALYYFVSSFFRTLVLGQSEEEQMDREDAR
jgi:hypothetical protein